MTAKRTFSFSKVALLMILAIACTGVSDAAPPDDQIFREGAIQRIADSYLNPLANPPKFETDLEKVKKLARTGDIIIENNLAFPQYYAIFGTLMPETKYVHAQMVISGEDLQRELAKLELLAGRSTLLKCMRVKGRKIKTPNGIKLVYAWEPYPTIDRKGLYCVGPEYVREIGNSYTVAMHLEECLRFPTNQFVSKAFRLLRPKGINDQARKLIASYLAYHVFMATPYDSLFSLRETETGIVRDENGKVMYNFKKKAIPLYCTEVIHRALRFANLPGSRLSRPMASLDTRSPLPSRSDWWKLPSSFGGPITVADGFLPVCEELYKNVEPVTPAKAREQAQLLKPIHHEWKRTLATVKSRLGFKTR